MKPALLVANIFSFIFLLYLTFSNPTITGFVVNDKITIANPADFAAVFIILTFALDVYFYRIGKKEK
ncbi:MAG: hypothetical protein QF824_02885 [Candidatus Woesearchaeota archaeon]|jgi:hypothetical protein|nr:hypothetical protein [Candidatus Woesearchaeota archaeon]